MGHTFLVYTVLRLLVFAGVYGVLVLLGMNGFPAVLLALLLSSLASLFLLRQQRLRLARLTEERRIQHGVDKDRMRDLLHNDVAADGDADRNGR